MTSGPAHNGSTPRNPEDCPCRYCHPPKRTPTCHGSCPDYKKWTVIDAAKKEKIQAARREERVASASPRRKIISKWNKGSAL